MRRGRGRRGRLRGGVPRRVQGVLRQGVRDGAVIVGQRRAVFGGLGGLQAESVLRRGLRTFGQKRVSEQASDVLFPLHAFPDRGKSGTVRTGGVGIYVLQEIALRFFERLGVQRILDNSVRGSGRLRDDRHVYLPRRARIAAHSRGDRSQRNKQCRAQGRGFRKGARSGGADRVGENGRGNGRSRARGAACCGRERKRRSVQRIRRSFGARMELRASELHPGGRERRGSGG